MAGTGVGSRLCGMQSQMVLAGEGRDGVGPKPKYTSDAGKMRKEGRSG